MFANQIEHVDLNSFKHFSAPKMDPPSYLETENEKIMLPALRRVTDRNTEDLNVHIIYAGQYNLDWIEWKPDMQPVLKRIIDTGLKSPRMTFIYMYRVGLRYLT